MIHIDINPIAFAIGPFEVRWYGIMVVLAVVAIIGITLLEAWYPFDRPEPRLSHVGWMRHVPLLARVMGIFHYRLGEVSE